MYVFESENGCLIYVGIPEDKLPKLGPPIYLVANGAYWVQEGGDANVAVGGR